MKFTKIVIEEAKALRKHASEVEISKLDFNTLNPNSVTSCIYGQMTGHCYSPRAVELIENSCKRVYTTNGGFAESKLNGSPVGKFRRNDGKALLFGLNTTYWSPIELFITKATLKQKSSLIKFIKGEIKTL